MSKKGEQKQGSQREGPRFLFSFRINYRQLRDLYTKKILWTILIMWKWCRNLSSNTTKKNMNCYCNDYDILRHSTGKLNISSFYFASESISFSSTDQIYPLSRVEGPDGKMVILSNANEGWDLSWDFCFNDLSGKFAASRFTKKNRREPLLESCLLIYVAENASVS